MARHVLADFATVTGIVPSDIRQHKEWTMTDPFGTVRLLASRREEADWAWRCEVMNLKAAGLSLRAIADAAAVSHDTVWRIR